MKKLEDICFCEVANSRDSCERFYLDLYLPEIHVHDDMGNSCAANHQRVIKFETTNSCIRYRRNYSSSANCKHGERDFDLCSKFQLSNADEKGDIQQENINVHRQHYEKPKYSLIPNPGPFVIFIHGGGWRRGAKLAWTHYLKYDINFLVCFLLYLTQSYSNIGEAMANSGIPCAVVSYPLTETSTGFVILEMCMSYVQSCVFTFVTSIPIVLASTLFRSFLAASNSSYTSCQSWTLLFNDHRDISVAKLYLLLVMLWTNCISLGVILFSRHSFKLTKRHCVLVSLFLAMTSLGLLFLANGVLMLLIGLCLVTMVITQAVILRVRMSRQHRTNVHQLGVVSSAITWVREWCETTRCGDPNSLYLMGHSAGGHLATLATLKQGALDNNTQIKGVISVSGVYDLECMDRAFVKPMYLQPTFGRKRANWLRSSPAHIAMTTETTVNTRFLLLSAERDLFLKQQSLDFHDVLKSKGIQSEHIELKGTNHLNIITKGNSDTSSTLGLAIDFVKENS